MEERTPRSKQSIFVPIQVDYYRGTRRQSAHVLIIQGHILHQTDYLQCFKKRLAENKWFQL